MRGCYYLITVDRFSNWPKVSIVKSNLSTAGASELIHALKRNFATFGVPEQLSSDGGPEFVSKETDTFFQRWVSPIDYLLPTINQKLLTPSLQHNFSK